MPASSAAKQTRPPGVTIGPFLIGPDRPTLIVAEAGVNHDGRLDAALRLVDIAADAGANAVKFQLFRADDLVTASAPTADYQKKGCGESAQRNMLKRLELTDDDFAAIRKHCARRSILFLATPFSTADLGRLVDWGVPAIKIASTDLTNVPLLESAADADLPLIVSTGASTADEIRASVQRLRDLGVGDRLVLMHCVSAYPAPLNILNLRAIRELRDQFAVPCGLSDHTLSTQTGAWAAAAGACVLEKHFTLDGHLHGPDHAMSLNPSQLIDYVSHVRAVETALGSGALGMNDLECDVRQAAGRSIVAAVDLPAGAVLVAEHLTCKRPGDGLAPADWHRVLGRRTRVPIPNDTLLSWNMLQ